MYHFEARWTRQTLDGAKIYLDFFPEIFGPKLVEKSENFRLKTECNQRFIMHRLASIGLPYMEY